MEYITNDTLSDGDLVPKIIKPYLFVCWANRSDVGKDLVAELISKYIQCTIIKFSRAFKTPLEQWLCIPDSSLDNKEFRVTKVKNPVTGEEELFTHNELMYHFFHQFKNLYPGNTGNNWFIPGGTKTTILNTEGHISIVDCRNQTEVTLLKQLSNRYNIILLHIIGDRGEQKSTDKDIQFSDWKFVDSVFVIHNDKSVLMTRLEQQVFNVLAKLNLC